MNTLPKDLKETIEKISLESNTIDLSDHEIFVWGAECCYSLLCEYIKSIKADGERLLSMKYEDEKLLRKEIDTLNTDYTDEIKRLNHIIKVWKGV